MTRVVSVPDLRAGFRDLVPIVIVLSPFGLVCGVAAAGVGASFIDMLGLSAIVFSGAAQVLAMQLYAADAPVAVIVLSCFVIGLRLMMYSAAIAPHFAILPPRWQHASAFLLTDQAFAATIRRLEDTGDKRGAVSYFIGAGFALWAGWQIANIAGYLGGGVVPASWQLEFAVPLCFIGLAAPLLRNSPTIVAALSAGVAVVLLAGMPMGLNLIVAGLIGIVAGASCEVALRRRVRA